MTAAAPIELPSSGRSIPSLDGLRAFAVLAVVVTHALEVSTARGIGALTFFMLGPIGVDVFFVISGFLITTLLSQELERHARIDLPRFYFRRLLRIVPPFYAYLTCIAVASALGLLPEPGRAWPAWAFVANFAKPGHWNLSHAWSLSVEEQFYLSWPFILAALGYSRATRFVLCVCFALPIARVLVGYVAHDGIVGPLWGFVFLAAGCLLALSPPWVTRLRTWTACRGRMLLFGLLLFVAGQVAFTGSFRLRWVMRLIFVDLPGAAILALAVGWCVAHPQSFVGRLLNSRPLRIIGIGSYSIYLWQQVFFAVETRVVISLPIALASIAVMSTLSYFLIERPSLALRSHLERRCLPAAATRVVAITDTA